MTPIDFALILGVALSLHRIWNYEPICAWLKGKLEKIKPIRCAACNAFWLGAATVALWYFTPPFVSMALASYLPVRVLVWLYDRPVVAPMKPLSLQKLPAQAPAPAPTRKATKTVVVMTALGDFRSSYSIAQDAVNNTKGIAMTHPEWDVQLWTQQRCTTETLGALPPNVQHRPLFPPVNMQPDVEDPKAVLSLQAIMNTELSKIQTPLAIITHDLLFISWFLNYAKAIHALIPVNGTKWFHVCHSMPGSRDHTPSERCNLPDINHTIITVSSPGVDRFKAYYASDRVLHIPNIRDPRSLGMPPAAEAIANKMKLWDADVVTVFPTCTTRMDAKGVHKLLRLFAVLNRSVKAKLVLCNPNAAGSKSMAALAKLRSLANTYGLTDDVLGFTSDILPKLAVHGIPSADVLALMNVYGNVFAFPSISESDSLVLLEARLARQFILVNGDAQGVGTAQAEASRLPGGCVSIPWGATATVGDTDEVATMAAQHVLGFIHSNPQEASRRAVLRTRNLEVIGNQWAEAFNAAGPAP